MDTTLNAVTNPYELNSPGRKQCSLLAVWIGVASTIMISMTASLMLPIAAEEFGAGTEWSMGISLGSVISIVCMPLYGYLTARNPHIKRPLFVISFIISGTVVLLRGVAPNMWVIIVPTLVLTIYSPAIYVIGYSLVRDMYGMKKGAQYLGFVATMQGIGLLVGPVVGSMMIQNLGWRSVNFLIAPLLYLCALLMFFGARITKEEGQTIATSRGKFDYPGAIAVSVMLASLIVMLSMTSFMPWGSPGNLALIVIAILSLIWLASIVKKKGNDAFLPAPVLKDRNTRFLFLINFCFTFSAMGMGAFLPSFLMYVMMKEPTTSGIASAFYAVAGLFMGPIYGRIMAKTGTARETVMYSGGLLRCAVQLAMLFIVVMHHETVPIYAVYIIMFVGGFYSAVGGVTPAVAPQVQLREEIRPLGNSIIQLGANFGSSVGIAIFSAVIATVGLEQGFKTLLFITSFISILDFVFAMPLKKLPEFEAIAEAKKAEKQAKKDAKNN
ncbi:MAG: MFS transporter [Clostridiales Family XIII bacterium]|jgi:MFS family permease|nr:MFS transporter [Clostridiales Family XIII bacterium]